LDQAGRTITNCVINVNAVTHIPVAGMHRMSAGAAKTQSSQAHEIAA
jgi:hypothetical protein